MPGSPDLSRKSTGGCLCGAVRYELRGPLRDIMLCHCSQCRRFHGHAGPYTAVAREGFHLIAERGLSWYRSSEIARRGFCGICGSSLFWERLGAPRISIAAGSLDPPTGLKIIRHTYVADKSDYYQIDDSVEQFPDHGPA
jgi:hypothetical protein